MYTIYKYEWDSENQVGGTVEIVLPRANGTFICFFDTSQGVDMRMLSESTRVPEYMPPKAQAHCAVHTATMPFFGLSLLRKTLLHSAFAAALRRLRVFRHRHVTPKRFRFIVRQLAQTYSWTLMTSEFQ
jgi:hypothetical protein